MSVFISISKSSVRERSMYPWGWVTSTSKPNFEKNINVAHSGSFESYDFLCDHLWLVSHPICACQTDSIRLSSLWPEAMALQPWIQKVKKNEKEETKGPPQKMLCTPYEKQLKKMPGDLTMLKDISV